MRVYVLIPVHNRISQTMECLGYLKRQTYKDIRIVVVDDGSTDGTSERIRERYPEVEVLRGDGNLWWTGAMHMGVEHILKDAGEEDFILSLNNDTAFDPEFVESLVKASIDCGRAITGSMEKDYHDRGEILFRGAWLDWEHFRLNGKKGPLDDENELYNEHVNVLPGRGTIVPVEIFREIGNYDKEKFPHYIADYDFTMRAYNAGFKMVLSYNSIIYTRSDLTGISIKERKPLSLREAYTNYFSIRSDQNIMDHIRFIRAHCPGKYRKRNISMYILKCLSSLRVLSPVRMAYQSVRNGFKRKSENSGSISNL